MGELCVFDAVVGVGILLPGALFLEWDLWSRAIWDNWGERGCSLGTMLMYEETAALAGGLLLVWYFLGHIASENP